MVNLISTTLPIAFAAVASARVCQNITVEVEITARNGVFNISAPETNVDVTDFTLDLAKQGGNLTAQVLTDYANVGGTYQLASTYCEPDSGPGNTIQILTHGIGFDRSYWDFSANAYNYSYVGPVVDEYGFSTLAWDRLGIAQSSHGEPVNEIQAWLEVAALRALTDKVRDSTIPGLEDRKFAKVVHVGHSFGSGHTYALTAMYPDVSDGIILTGFAQNATFVASFILGGGLVQANLLDAFKGMNYSNGYLASGTEGAVQTNFFGPNNFDPEILTAAYEGGQPVTVGELLTVAGEAASMNAFTKPVLIITGERDIPFCGGDCLATGNPELPSIPASSAMIFQNASAFEAYIVADAGHGLTLSYSHDEVTGKMADFLYQNGLGCLI
ncbi:hypothetical protein CkaCkLH20_03841 [Colletotrichum karsti]|uniref:AB hydrolase-1 domain-containing protein n=1 Tax=Colletotrichum karsti TaxID=1095194 RepID=A0A9P6LN84_9PEZI|nr:uncharacterized protein CkaCkLH20_03841 [Colletotrichum karsti]KAF9878941.1 hypothetical protein CkaCkLH20_03841 [Colletotrichum karsti]